MIHFSFADFYYPSYIRLAERLAAWPLAAGRTRSICAIRRRGSRGGRKACGHATRRPYIWPSTTPSWTDAGRRVADLEQPVQRRGFSPLLPGVFHAHYPTLSHPVRGPGAGMLGISRSVVPYRAPAEETAASLWNRSKAKEE